MKKVNNWFIAPLAAATLLATASVASSQPVQLTPGFQPDPQVLTGTSGGEKSSPDCGFISAAPSQVIRVTQAFSYLRFSVQSEGSPTLLIDGPGGRFCVLADSTGGGPQMSGFWSEGTYSVFVGDRSQGRQPYRLTISQQQN